MKSKIVFLILLTTICSCDHSGKTATDSIEIIDSIIEHQQSLTDKRAEVFLNTGDTIVYHDFILIPQTSKLTGLHRENALLFLAIEGMTSPKIELDQYFDLKDSSFVIEQVSNNVSMSLDTTRLNCKTTPYYHEFSSYFQVDSIIKKYNTDLVILDRPIFNSKRNSSMVCYAYVQKPYQILKLVQLKKDSSNNKWQLVKQYGVVTKYIPKNNDEKNDSIFHEIFVGSIEREFDQNKKSNSNFEKDCSVH